MHLEVALPLYNPIRSCTTVYARVPPYTLGSTVYARVPPYTLVYHRIRSCTTVYARVPPYTLVYHRIRSCSTVYARVPPYTLVYHRIRIYIQPHNRNLFQQYAFRFYPVTSHLLFLYCMCIKKVRVGCKLYGIGMILWQKKLSFFVTTVSVRWPCIVWYSISPCTMSMATVRTPEVKV